MVFLLTARSVVLIFSDLLATTILALSCAVIYMHSREWGIMHSVDSATSLSVAICILHICTVTPMIILDFFRYKSFFSTVIVEASWLFVIWLLWLATAAVATSAEPGDYLDDAICGWYISSRCYAHRFIEIFSFINWIQLMIYTNTLSTLAVIGHLRRQPMWLSTVRDAPILSSPLALTMPSEYQFKPAFFSNSTVSMSYAHPLAQPFSPPPPPPAVPATVHPLPPHAHTSSETSPMLYHIPGTPMAPPTPRSPLPGSASIPLTPVSPNSQAPFIEPSRPLPSTGTEQTQPPPPSYSDRNSSTGPAAGAAENVSSV